MGNLYKIILKICRIKYGKNLKLKGIPVIAKSKKATLIIGENVTIKSSFLSNLIGLYQRSIIIARTPQSKITIGDNVGMSGVTIYARNEITIGKNTLIGANTKILDNDFHPLEIKDRNNDVKEKIKTTPVIIGENCFIGCNVIILKGTQLGEGCIVGAGAVVSGKYEDNSIIVGNPATTRKKNEDK